MNQKMQDLEAVGGFEEFQNWLRGEVLQRAKRKSLETISSIDEVLALMGYNVDGLEQGLTGVISGSCTKPFTSDNFSNLQFILDFNCDDMIGPKIEQLLRNQQHPGSEFITRDDQGNESVRAQRSEYYSRCLGVLDASDAEIVRRQNGERRKIETTLQS